MTLQEASYAIQRFYAAKAEISLAKEELYAAEAGLPALRQAAELAIQTINNDWRNATDGSR